jgi:hypothetical protein
MRRITKEQKNQGHQRNAQAKASEGPSHKGKKAVFHAAKIRKQISVRKKLGRAVKMSIIKAKRISKKIRKILNLLTFVLYSLTVKGPKPKQIN